MKQLGLVAVLFASIGAYAQTVHITPVPVKTVLQKGVFGISKNTVLVLNDESEQVTAEFLNLYLKNVYGFELQTAPSASSNYIRFATRRFVQPPENPGKYSLQVKPTGVDIEGDSYQGTFYGLQSLIQLLPVTKTQKLSIPCLTVED